MAGNDRKTRDIRWPDRSLCINGYLKNCGYIMLLCEHMESNTKSVLCDRQTR